MSLISHLNILRLTGVSDLPTIKNLVKGREEFTLNLPDPASAPAMTNCIPLYSCKRSLQGKHQPLKTPNSQQIAMKGSWPHVAGFLPTKTHGKIFLSSYDYLTWIFQTACRCKCVWKPPLCSKTFAPSKWKPHEFMRRQQYEKDFIKLLPHPITLSKHYTLLLTLCWQTGLYFLS